MPRHRVAFLFALLSTLPLAPTPASAKGKKGQATEKAKEPPKADLDALRKRIAEGEAAAIAVLRSIADEGLTEAAPVVSEVLAGGSSPKVLEEAMKTAGKLKAESLSAALAPYVQHRSEELRRAAARTLVRTRGPAATSALVLALRSGDAAVRGTAATGLGTLGAKEALPDLFRAFDHGVAEAGASIGQLCAPEECTRFEERTGKVAFDIMATGFDQILFRPASEVTDDDKLRLVGRLREIGTPDVGKFLADVGERWPKEWSKKVKQAIDAAARAVGAEEKK